MIKFHVCSSETCNSFMENKMNNETQIENMSLSANRTISHDPKCSQGQQTVGLQVSRNSWIMFATLPTLFLSLVCQRDQLYEICYEPYYKGCYKIPYWKKLGQHMKKNYPGLVQQPWTSGDSHCGAVLAFFWRWFGFSSSSGCSHPWDCLAAEFWSFLGQTKHRTADSICRATSVLTLGLLP